MNVQSKFPVNEPFYEYRQIKDLKDLLDQSERLYSERPAYKLKNANKRYYDVSYKSFRHSVYYIANSLLSDGYKRTHIAIVGKNSYEWEATYLAVTCSNNVVVPLDKELTPENMADVIRDSDSTVLFGDKKYIKNLVPLKDQLPQGFRFICFDDIQMDGVDLYYDYIERGKKMYHSGTILLNDVTVDPEETTAILFTSGTTGVSKGVCLSQKNMCAVVMAVAGCIKVTPEDQLLSFLPIHHTYECTIGFLCIIYSGACIAFCEGLRYITKNFKEVKPTCFITVPLLVEKVYSKVMKAMKEKKGGMFVYKAGMCIAGASQKLGIKGVEKKLFSQVLDVFGGRLRLLITGAAAIDPKVAKDFMRMGINIYVGYGLTECAPLVACNNDRIMIPDSIGTPVPGAEVAIYNPDEKGVGELWVRGPMVMKGYYKNQEATDEVITPDGWFRTGDLGTVDRNNCYRLTGRCKNVIVTKNGKNIFPEEVEIYVNNSPYISECIVYDDEINGETAVCAAVYPDLEKIKDALKGQEPTKEDIERFVDQAIKDANWKLPKYKKIRDKYISETEFIKTTTSKIKRNVNIEKVKEAKRNQS